MFCKTFILKKFAGYNFCVIIYTQLRGDIMFLGSDYYYAYDIVLDENKLRVDIYKVSIEVKNGRDRCYKYDYLESSYPDDIKNHLQCLTAYNYISMKKFKNENYALSDNPLINLKLMLLGTRYELLEKVYDHHAVIEGMNKIVKYAHLINIYTGEEKVVEIGSLEVTEANIKKLLDSGFKSIDESPLMSHIDDVGRGTTQLR